MFISYMDKSTLIIVSLADGVDAELEAGRIVPAGLAYNVTEDKPLPEPVAPAEALAAERAGMACSRLQGRLVLGEATCDALDAMAADPQTPWAMRQTINNAIEWQRTSQAITELGYLLGYTETQMDDLFRAAMVVEV